MDSKAQRDSLIAALYAAAMGRAEWHVALAQLAACSGTRCITLDTYELAEHAGHVIASNMAPHPAIEEYNRVYGQRNILIETAYPGISPGRGFAATSLVAMREFAATELYNTVYRALGIKYAAGVLLENQGGRIVQLSLIKPQDGKDFSTAELRWISSLAPHLLQAWAGYAHVQQLNNALTTVTELWHCFEHAVIVVNRRRQIEFANRAAETLLRNGRWLRSHAGSLKMSDPGQAPMLKHAIAVVASGERDIQCLTPTSAGNTKGWIATLFRASHDRIALIISDPLRSQQDLRRGLIAAFGLTEMEADLVHRLIQGSSLHDCAASREISYETARTHLKNAMQKNGWRRQGEMIAAVLKRLLPLGSFGNDR